MKVTIDGFICWKKESWEKEGSFSFWGFEVDSMGYVTVMPHSIEIDVPDDFNPLPGQLAQLKKEEQELRAKFANDLTTLEERRSKLLAITNEVKS